MAYFKALLGAAIGALIGGVIWVAIGYFANLEVGYVAWGLGALAGLGVAVLVSDRERDVMTGIIAVGTSVIGIVAAKYIVVGLLVNHALAEQQQHPDPLAAIEGHKLSIAYDVTTEMEAAGKTLNWAPGKSIDTVEELKDFPQEVFVEAHNRYTALTPEAKPEFEKGQQELNAQLMGIIAEQAKVEAFKKSFSPFDILFFALAAMTAFRIGSSGRD